MKENEIGPFGTEWQASQSPAAQAVHAAFDRDPGAGKMRPHNLAVLTDALSAAEVTLGEFDRRIVSWLAGWEPTTVVVLAGIIRRAADGPAELADDSEAADRATMLAALADAAEYKRGGAAANCGACDADPSGPCRTCAWRLQAAGEYDALAAKLGGPDIVAHCAAAETMACPNCGAQMTDSCPACSWDPSMNLGGSDTR